jgi:hypothetical protein
MCKLTIELVPRTCWYSNVRSEVSEHVWDIIRRKTYRLANYKCEICGGVGPNHPVECHEKWEYTPTGTQVLVGFIALCPDCHRVKHIGRAQIVGEFGEALDQLMEVNNWSEEDAIEYIEEAFYLWEERSANKWDLDITYIERFISEEDRDG